MLEARGQLDEAQALKAKVVTLREPHLGPDHPSIGSALKLMGALYIERGDVEAAQRTINLGPVYQLRGEPTTALALH